MSIIRIGKPLGAISYRLFCLPPAGAGASTFYPLMALDSLEVNICPISLPGREGRLKEALPQSIPALANQLARDLSPYLDQPYAILGYSMGALLGYEIAQRLREWRQAQPIAFFPLAARPPHTPFQRSIHELEKEPFRRKLEELGGMPQELLDNEEAMSLYEPIIRQDFQNCDHYLCGDVIPLRCPIHAFVSDQDPLLSPDEVQSWADCTMGEFNMITMQGKSHILNRYDLLGIGREIIGVMTAK